jgi:hypothetical protein
MKTPQSVPLARDLFHLNLSAGHRWLGIAAMLAALFVGTTARAVSFQEDANGFVFLEAENFDLNVTQDNGAWLFDNTPLDVDPFSGWGYVTADSSGGTDTNSNPHLDYSVTFNHAGPYYIWVGGSDAGGKTLSLGLDGAAPASGRDIGGPDGIFGARYGGQVRWSGTNNTGSGYVSKAYLPVPAAGTHVVNLFIREAGLKVDWILLTTNVDYVPGPYPNPVNLPAQTLAPAASLGVAVTQPAAGKLFPSNAVVVLSAKPFTNAAPAATVEFFARLLPSGVPVKIGQAVDLPYAAGWSNAVPGQYALTAVVTDTGLARATSSVVNVTISVPSTYLTPLQWTTNAFDAGLGSFTRASQNHEGGFDFGWQNFAFPGGRPGVLGGTVVRSYTTVPYLGEPLARKVSLNEELWFHGTLLLSNVSANNDTFIGYFDSASTAHPRVGLKLREPTSGGGVWRFSVEPNGVKINATVASGTAAYFELHWIPTGVGNGSGTLTGTVAGLPFSVDYSATANAGTFDTFGWLAAGQGSDDLTKVSYQYFDDLAYVVPSQPRLDIQPLAGNRVLLHWAIDHFALQYRTNGAAGPGWTDASDTVVQQGLDYYVTNSVGAQPRWYRLKLLP